MSNKMSTYTEKDVTRFIESIILGADYVKDAGDETLYKNLIQAADFIDWVLMTGRSE
jgi:hypothetical protein